MKATLKLQSIIYVVLALLAVGLLTTTVAANFSTNYIVSGTSWSSNIGWVKMDLIGGLLHIRPDSADGSNDGQLPLEGHVWSSNIGWIKFGDISGCPGGSCDASINVITNEVTGWARACAATASGDCTGGLDPDGGGWDGWISLNCSNTSGCGSAPYGVTATGGSFSGYAWGGDVVGWLDMGGANYAIPCSSGYQCLSDLSGYEQLNEWCEVVATNSCATNYSCDTSNPGTCIVAAVASGTVTTRPAVSRSGATVDVTWTSSGAADCTLQQTNFGGVVQQTWTGTADTIESEPIESPTIFNLVCTDAGGLNPTDVASTTVRIIPDLIEI